MSQPLDEADQFIMGGGGAPSAFTKDTPLQKWIGGKVLDRRKTQQTDINGEPLWWDAEKTRPREQLEVTVQTDERIDGDDTGRRRFFVKGDLQFKTRDACVAAGVPGVKIGSEFYARRVGQDTPKQRGLSGAWLHEVRIVPAPAEEDNFLTGSNGHDAAPAHSAPTASNGASAPTGNGAPAPLDMSRLRHLTPQQLATAVQTGVSTEQALAMFPAPATPGGDGMAEFEPRLNRVAIKAKVPSITDAQLAAFEAANLDTATVLNMFGASV